MIIARPSTPTRNRPHGVRFSLRSVFVGMTVLAVVAAVLGPWIRSLPFERQLHCLYLVIAIGGGVIADLLSGERTIRISNRVAGELLCVVQTSVPLRMPWRHLKFWIMVVPLLVNTWIIYVFWLGLKHEDSFLPFAMLLFGGLVGFATSQFLRTYGLWANKATLRVYRKGVEFDHPPRFVPWIELEPPYISSKDVRFESKYSNFEFCASDQDAIEVDKSIQRLRASLDTYSIPYLTDDM